MEPIESPGQTSPGQPAGSTLGNDERQGNTAEGIVVVRDSEERPVPHSISIVDRDTSCDAHLLGCRGSFSAHKRTWIRASSDQDRVKKDQTC